MNTYSNKMTKVIKNRKGLLLVGTSAICIVLTLWLQSKHVSQSERARLQVIDFRPNDTEKYEKCDKGFLPDASAMSQSGYNIPVAPYDALDRFTVITMVFDRFKSYREVTQHYICMPFVDRVLLLWSNQEVKPPTRESLNVSCSEKLFVRPKSNALTERFANFPEIQTDAVFNVDDDLLFPASDLQRAFNVWKKYPWGLVGYVSRDCIGTAPNMSYSYSVHKSTRSYRMILTSAAFLHREYLRLFDEKCPAEVRVYIDRMKNCEDILMNFIVKDHCKCSGVFFVGEGHPRPPKHLKSTGALSARRTHVLHRTECLRKFLNLYSKNVNFTASKCIYN